MFGTEEAARIIVRELSAVPDVVSVVGDRIFHLPVFPGDSAFPGVMISPLSSDHNQPINGTGDVYQESVQVEVAFTQKGDSAGSIRAAANAGMKALRGKQFTEVIDGETWFVSTSSLGGLPRIAFVDEADVYRQLGGVLLIEFSRA